MLDCIWDSSYGRSLDDCNSLNNFFLVHLSTWAVKIAHDGSHAGLVAHGGSKVYWLLGVILGKAVKCFSFDFLKS